jgi:hypothetical protein
MANDGKLPRKSNEAQRDATAPRHVYPEPLTEEDLAAMDDTLPDEVTAVFLRWLETGDPLLQEVRGA